MEETACDTFAHVRSAAIPIAIVSSSGWVGSSRGARRARCAPRRAGRSRRCCWSRFTAPSCSAPGDRLPVPRLARLGVAVPGSPDARPAAGGDPHRSLGAGRAVRRLVPGGRLVLGLDRRRIAIGLGALLVVLMVLGIAARARLVGRDHRRLPRRPRAAGSSTSSSATSWSRCRSSAWSPRFRRLGALPRRAEGDASRTRLSAVTVTFS